MAKEKQKKKQETKNKGGAKGKYREWLEEDNLLRLEAWARDGYTDEQIAQLIGISVRTLYIWKTKYMQIFHALKKGKDVIDIEVEKKLLQRAMGYEYEEVRTIIEDNGTDKDGKPKQKKRVEKITKHVAPDTTAQFFWLKNRQPEKWRDKQDIEHSGGMTNRNVDMSIEEAERIINGYKFDE